MKKIFGNWWVVTGLIVLLLLLVLCVGLPFFVAALRPLWVRLAIGGGLLAIWGLVGFLRVRKARKAADAIAKELATPSAADQESVLVAQRMQEALASLRSSSGGRRDYLYSRPWYVIIGPPGAGKTTALLNSGLRFPFADESLKGVGGTRNLDFWFADEAALVDTAGRYTTQDSDASVDTQGWKSFLGQLKQSRPKSPINGVIVAIGVDELLRLDRAGLDRHAAMVRRRLVELRATLEVAMPVYLLLTKADLIAGFVEFYDDLDVEGRRAVLGATLPVENTKPALDDVVAQFDRLVNAQSERQAKRLYEEVDQTRRSLLLGFPAQLAGLRNRFSRFIDGAFIAGDAPAAILRGFYFTSGVQEGAPLDRILAGVADAFQSGGAGRAGSGRTYFLNRLLTEVVFKEAGLVQADLAARRRQQRRVIAGIGAIAAATAVVVGLWTVSFIKNRAFLKDLSAAAGQVATLERQIGLDSVEVRDTDPTLEEALPALNALRALPQGYAQQQAGEPGLMRRFGLYQTSQADQAEEAYHDGLRRIMLPRLLLRLEQYLRANVSDPAALYQPLKVYLMLGGMGPMDKGAVRSWVTQDWADEQFPGSDRDPMRKELTNHLNVLLNDDSMGSAWPGGRKAPLDGNTIASARAALATLSLADRAYAVLKHKALSSDGAPWRASAALAAGDAQAFVNGREVLQLEVPYFFTLAGHQKAYQLGLTTVAADFQRDLWVLGDAAGTEGVKLQIGQIRPNVARLYARDYISAWEKVATTPKPAAYFSDAAALGAFTKTPSPLKVLLLELRKNTSFSGGAARKIADDAVTNSRFGRIARNVRAVAADSYDAGTEINNYFKPLHDYVGDGKTPGPVDEFVNAVKQAGSAVASARVAGGGQGSEAAQGQMAQAMGGVATTAGAAPAQLKDFVASAATGGTSASVSAAQGAISDAYATAILPDCKLATTDKYPFFGAAKEDASLVDVQRVFGLNGLVDAFIQQRIVPLLDMSGPIWRWNATNPTTATLSPSSPDEFSKARQLRDLLIGGLAVKFETQSFGTGVDGANLTVGGAQYRFDAANPGQKPVIWSIQGNVPQASLKLFMGEQEVGAVPASGPWALFRLMDSAKLENGGPQTVLATFGSGAQTVVFKVSLPNEQNPFIRGGSVWSFRCPVAL